MQFGKTVGEQHDRHVHPPEQRIGRPRHDPHEPASTGASTGCGITRRREILAVIEHHGNPLSLLGRVDEVAFEQGIDRRDRLIGIAWPVGGVAHPLGEPLRHRSEPVGVGPGQRPQPLSHVIRKHDVPTAKQLPRQKIGHRTPAGRRLALRRSERHEIADIAVQQKHAARTGEIGVAEPFRPRRAPRGQRGRGTG